MTRVVVLGGAGNFGARIVRALHAGAGFELISAGRRAMPVPGAPHVPTVELDLAAPDFAASLKHLAPHLVIHCAGPFQHQDYSVAHAALAAGADYVDLADGRDFVAGFAAAMNATAVHAGRIAISGASTVPALSSAVVDELVADLSAASIRIVIAPGQLAPRGAATLTAVFSYLGRPVRVWRAGRWQTDWGWMGLEHFQLGFARRWGAVCDIADLALLPVRYPGVQSVSFHAALEMGVQHVALWALAALRRAGLPLPVEQWAGALDSMATVFDRFAGPWSGMQVQVSGTTTAGITIRRSWTLQAPVLHGPEVPCMPAALLARRLAYGIRPAAGAYPCVGFLRLDEFEPLFAGWAITTHRQECAT